MAKSQDPKATILVTGGAGYLGSALVSTLLASSYKVHALDLGCYGMDSLFHLAGHPNLAIYRGDVCHPLELDHAARYCDLVVHLASVRSGQATIESTLMDGTICVASLGIPVIHISGPVSSQPQLDAESIILEESAGVVFRAASIFGVSPRMRLDLLVHDWCFELYHRSRLKCHDSEATRSLVHINDVVGAMVWAVAKILFPTSKGSLLGNTYDLTNPDLNTTKWDLAMKIGAILHEACGRGVRIDKDYWDTAPDIPVEYMDPKPLSQAGYKCKLSLEAGVTDLLRIIPAFDFSEKARYMAKSRR
uniref:Putative NADH dehydrogenase n=1 Tax=viral metagenome TaxID=1070528 RepID=A0A6M3INQ1_9ZZZZ